jgi:hypothetical protein
LVLVLSVCVRRPAAGLSNMKVSKVYELVAGTK